MKPKMDDAELLRRYVADRSDTAFGDLVRRHVDLVYSAALRRMSGNHHQAQEVTQMVFLSLARKASGLLRHPLLPAWLHRATGLAAADLRRREGRRHSYERAFAAEAPLVSNPEPADDWRRIGPLLDAALDGLADRDRAAIMLRFFANRPYADVGRHLGLSENAARMRVDRAMDKLRVQLSRRGIASSSAALAAGLASEAVAAAPSGVAAAAILTSTAVGPAGTGILLFMSANKIALGVVALVAAAGVGTRAIQERFNAHWATRVADLRTQAASLAALQRENERLVLDLDRARSRSQAGSDGPALRAQLEALKAEVTDLHRQMNARHTAAPSGPRVYNPAELDVLPRLTHPVAPAYPAALRIAGTEGQVEVQFFVDATGRVANAQVSDSTEPALEQSALDAVTQWTFSPAQKGGASVSTSLRVPIVFSLTANGTPPPAAASEAPQDWFPSGKG